MTTTSPPPSELSFDTLNHMIANAIATPQIQRKATQRPVSNDNYYFARALTACTLVLFAISSYLSVLLYNTGSTTNQTATNATQINTTEISTATTSGSDNFATLSDGLFMGL